MLAFAMPRVFINLFYTYIYIYHIKMANDDGLVFENYTSIGVALTSLTFLIVLCFSCQPVAHWQKSLSVTKFLTIYAIFCIVVYGFVSYGLYTCLLTLEAFSGIDQIAHVDQEKYVKLTALALTTHIVDFFIKIYRGGTDRIQCANYVHLSIFPILGVATDNADVMRDGGVAFMCLCLTTQGISVYVYRLFATWGKCVTPLSQTSTAFQLTVFAILIFHSGFAIYYSIHASSPSRAVFSGLVFVYSSLMTLSVMRLFFKDRSTHCCHSMKTGNDDGSSAGNNVVVEA